MPTADATRPARRAQTSAQAKAGTTPRPKGQGAKRGGAAAKKGGAKAATETPKRKPLDVKADQVRELVTGLVNEHATDAPNAPAKGKPYCSATHAYVHRDQVAKAMHGPLADAVPNTVELGRALRGAGFSQAPYGHTEKVAGYWMIERGKLAGLKKDLPTREVASRPPRAGRGSSSASARSANSAAPLANPLPAQPDGTPEDKAECEALWQAAYDAAEEAKRRRVLRRQGKATPQQVTAAEGKAREAKEAWEDKRRAMVAKARQTQAA